MALCLEVPLRKRQLLSLDPRLEATGVYPSAPSNFDCSKIIEITVDEIQALFLTGELTSRALIECYLQRIADFDNPITFKGEVAYATNSVIELNPTVLADADAKDAERAACLPTCNLSKIHGIPVLLKDNVAADGMNVTAGSYALLGGYHSPAFLTILILNAGGIILGKAGLSEWANFRSIYSVSGWSGRGGQVNDPYVRYFIDGQDNITDPYTNIPSAVTPGVYYNASNPGIVSGSSSGSAVAAAANMVTLTIGSETSGSILSPSQFNAVAGIKPTVGLVSRSGVVPLSASQDTAGPMCRTLTDATYLLDVIAAPDATDPVTLTQVVPAGGYAQFLNKNGLQGKKIAIGPVGPYDGADDQIMAAYAKAAEFMRSAGATVDVLPDNFTLPGDDLSTGLLLWYDFKQNIATYLSEVTWAPGVTPKNNLEDLIQFNLDNYLLEFQGGTCCRGQVAYGNFFQDIFDVAQNTSGFDDPTYMQYKANAAQTKVLIEQFFQSNGYDAITSLGDYIDDFARTQQPGVTVPLALSAAGYPLGIIFHGLSYTEGKLIEIAYAFEQGFGFGRPAPTYCDSASCS
ncbi:hypothetical protein KFL_000070160 [Klebsormidium nitens]|uniref:Amidase domain-containing protein n=1 Tax=Klebsormidium nitens TaxID=105231 RepID=A0A1Y1HN67_KLENI|nr:hypothetical protein KFL_000070160 [Klebsormidium nitens]|eukprot:GAQ78046.1 hypothetical protein KFL_000070160 [Klebsormidium nitens]